MTVSFNEIPSDILTPGHFVEIDATGAIEGTGARPHAALIVGYRLAGGTQDTVTLDTGTVAENIPTRVTKVSSAQGFFGRRSQAVAMTKAWLEDNERTTLYVMGIDAPSGTAATGTVTFTASTPAAGVQNVYVAGHRYQVSVTTASTPTTLAATLVALVNANIDSPVTASAVVGVVTLLAVVDGP